MPGGQQMLENCLLGVVQLSGGGSLRRFRVSVPALQRQEQKPKPKHLSVEGVKKQWAEAVNTGWAKHKSKDDGKCKAMEPLSPGITSLTHLLPREGRS